MTVNNRPFLAVDFVESAKREKFRLAEGPKGGSDRSIDAPGPLTQAHSHYVRDAKKLRFTVGRMRSLTFHPAA